jgi:hypothetical protein
LHIRNGATIGLTTAASPSAKSSSHWATPTSAFAASHVAMREVLDCQVSLSLDVVGEETRRWQPMSREQFAELVRGWRVRDRQGRVWTITAEHREEHGLAHVIMRSGDLVRRVNERYADEYMLVEDAR